MSLAPLFLAALAAAPAQDGERRPISEILDSGQNLVVEQVLFILNEEMITSSMVEAQMLRLQRSGSEQRGPNLFWQALADLSRQLVALEGFRRLGLDEAALDAEVTQRMDQLIESSGSRARFEESLRRDGYTMASFRDYLKGALISLQWQRIVTGEQPSPLQGFRARTEPSPAEILAEFERDPSLWEQGFEVVWKVLQFSDRNGESGVARAEEFAAGLKAGSVSLAEAEAAAQSSQRYSGDPADRNLRAAIREFLLQEPTGAVSAVQPIPDIGGMFFVVIERSPARVISFEEAQARIAVEIRRRKSEEALAAAQEAIVRSSYTWYPDLPELQLREFFDVLFQRNASGGETEF